MIERPSSAGIGVIMQDTVEHQRDQYVDVLIVGAGLSGIGGAYDLQRNCPSKSFAILEAATRLAEPGTCSAIPASARIRTCTRWATASGPGGGEKAIADGPSILQYIRDTAEEFGIDRHIRFGHRARRAVLVLRQRAMDCGCRGRAGEAEPVRYSCNFLYMCSGYYDYADGYMPGWPGMDRFAGPHRASAAMAGRSGLCGPPGRRHRQRRDGGDAGPGDGGNRPRTSPCCSARRAMSPRGRPGCHRQLAAPAAAGELAHGLTRWKNVLYGMFFYNLAAKRRPETMKTTLINRVREQLGPDYDVDKHFTPHYNPWDQRLCLVPDADLFEAIRSGKASVVTDEIETLHRDRPAAALGREARRRHHRHRHRPEGEADGRHAGHRRRRSGRSVEDPAL